jgi:hypothetical protein
MNRKKFSLVRTLLYIYIIRDLLRRKREEESKKNNKKRKKEK